MKTRIYLFLIFFSTTTMLGSCSVLLIGAYDQVTDQGIQKIQTETSELLITLKKNLINNDAASNNYANFSKTYNGIEAEIESLSIRSKALPKYSIITGEIDKLNKNIMDLEALHKSQLFSRIADTSIVNTNMRTFEVQFSAMIALQNGLKREKTTK